MPLDVQEPTFDRPFTELYEELRARIPVYNPAWTNFNDSDPGITLLQLFAWLSEMLLHQMGQVPRKNYLKFAQLLGLELRPPRPATVQLSFTPKPNEPSGSIPVRSRYSASVPGQPPLIFETDKGLDLIGAPLEAVVVAADGTVKLITPARNDDDAPFYPLGRNPEIGNALYLGFKPSPGNPAPFPRRMTFLALRPTKDTSGVPRKIGDQRAELVAPVELVWEYRPKRNQPVWERLNLLVDETAALTRDGYVEVEGPRTIEPSLTHQSLVPEPHFWLRLRLDQRSYPAGRSPRLQFLLPNAVDAVNLTTEQETFLGVSSGGGGQTFDLPERPVEAKSLELVLRRGTVDTPWERKDDLLGSSPTDLHYTLNAAQARITFGDREHGAIPTAGDQIVARVFRHGGVAAANQVKAGGVSEMVTQVAGVDQVTNVRSPSGGSDEQSVDDFQKQAPSQLRHRGRAITAEDFTAFAMEIDGVNQARALPNRHPDFPGVPVAGAITVVIVADSDQRPPKPSAELIRSVCDRLENVRLITTEVYVAGPTFLRIRVEARLLAVPEAAFDEVALSARARLDALLDARRRKLGTDLSLSEIYRQLFEDEQQRIRSVEDVLVYVDDRLHEARGPIKVPADAVVYAGDHLIVVQPEVDEDETS
jgi:predicted phage baseplate assembly protein